MQGERDGRVDEGWMEKVAATIAAACARACLGWRRCSPSTPLHLTPSPATPPTPHPPTHQPHQTNPTQTHTTPHRPRRPAATSCSSRWRATTTGRSSTGSCRTSWCRAGTPRGRECVGWMELKGGGRWSVFVLLACLFVFFCFFLLPKKFACLLFLGGVGCVRGGRE
jgi:hypothetical protein